MAAPESRDQEVGAMNRTIGISRADTLEGTAGPCRRKVPQLVGRCDRADKAHFGVSTIDCCDIAAHG